MSDEEYCISSANLKQIAALALMALSDEDRLDLFVRYCRSCGTDDPHCQCQNDE